MKQGLILLVLLVFSINILVKCQQPRWRQDLVDELTMDEWPVDDDMEERRYEMEALIAERQLVQQQGNNDNININNNKNEQDDDEEEEDDVDEDDLPEDNDNDDEEQEEEEEEIRQNSKEGVQKQSHDDQDGKITKDGPFYYDEDYENDILIPTAPVSAVLANGEKIIQATSRLQQQEERQLAKLDQSIVDTLERAIVAVQRDRPVRYIPILNASSPLLASPPTNIFFPTSHPWITFFILGLILSFAVASIRKSKQRTFRDNRLPVQID